MTYVPVEHRYRGEKILTCPECGYSVVVAPLEGYAVIPEAKCPVCNGLLSDCALTRREKEIVELISDGFSTKEIARRLSISTKTVESHRITVFNKLKIKDVANLTKYALKHGLTKLEIKCRGLK